MSALIFPLRRVLVAFSLSGSHTSVPCSKPWEFSRMKTRWLQKKTLIFLLLVEFSFKWAEIQTVHSPLLLPLPAAAEGNAGKAPKA